MAGDEPPTGVPAGAQIRTGWRFNPQVIVFGLTFVAMFYAAKGAVVGFVHAWWADSYRQVVFVMEEWRPNEGYPYVAGRLADGSESPFGLGGKVVDGKRVLEDAPSVAFEPGARVSVWWSDDAPGFTYDDESTNGIPVDAKPELPGWGRVALHALLTVGVAIAGFGATIWTAARFARRG